MKLGLTYTARRSNGGVTDGDLELDDAEEEFDSPETIDAIATALRHLGYDVELLGDGPPLAERLIQGPPIDLVFNIAEGRGIGRCREAWTPAMLEMFGIAYTGSDPLTLAATLDKHCAKRLVSAAGIRVPTGVRVDRPTAECMRQLRALPLPVIVKPAFEGSSRGVRKSSLVREANALLDTVQQLRDDYRQPVLVEEFIDGDELTVGIVGNAPPKAIAIMRVLPLHANGPFVYSLDVKRDWRRQVRYETPARLSPVDSENVRQAALAAFRALECRDVARIDFRLRDGVPYFLEANPLPGLTPGSSDLVLLAEGAGVGYRELIGKIVKAARSRLSRSGQIPPNRFVEKSSVW